MAVDDKTRQEFEKWGKTPPTSDPHGTDEDIRANLKRLKCHSWYLQGNNLVAQTEMGELVQRIPTDYICRGVDAEGLPILEKVQVKK